MRYAKPAFEDLKRNRTRHAATTSGARKSMIQKPFGLLPAVLQAGMLPSNVPQTPSIHEVQFGMYLAHKGERASCTSLQGQTDQITHPKPQILHSYTKIQTEKNSSLREFHDIKTWRLKFPKLQLYDETGRSVPAFLFETGIQLKDEYISDTQICIELDISIVHATGYTEWKTHTQIQEVTGWRDLKVGYPEVQENLHFLKLHGIFMGADYWAELFTKCVKARYYAKISGDTGQIQREEANIKRFFNDIYMHQQLWGTPPGSKRPRCVATLLWRFDSVGRDVVPTTSWRPLSIGTVPPPEPSIPRFHQKFGAIGTVSDERQGFANNMPVESAPTAVDFGSTFTTNHPQLLRAEENLTSIESSPTTDLITDAGSSTSLSFPPSVSSSASLTQQSQQSSFDSYHMVDICNSFDASNAHEHQAPFDDSDLLSSTDMRPKDLNEAPMYNAVDSLALPQEQYNNIFQLSDFQTFDPAFGMQQDEPPTLPSTGPDFIGGDIRLSYEIPNPAGHDNNNHFQSGMHFQQQGPESGPNAYGSPLVAPRAQVAAHNHNHILQLQHFDDLQHGFIEKPPSEHPELMGEAASCDPIEINEPVGASEYSEVKREEPDVSKSTGSDLDLVWQQKLQHDLQLPPQHHLEAYISPFSDPPQLEAFDGDLQDWQCIEVTECLAQDLESSDAAVGVSLV